MRTKLAAGISVLFLCACLFGVDEVATLPEHDPCKTTTPQAGCLKISTAAYPVSVVRPSYPKHGKKRGLVNLKATITETGELKGLQAVSGPDALKQVALDAVRQWRYRPATINGIPVEVQHDIIVDFTKRDGVLLGSDDLAPNLPMHPTEDLNSLLRTGELLRIGRSVKLPQQIFSPDPEYSDLARRNKYQGVCVLSLIVSTEGTTRDIYVVRPLGEGLDEKAIAAVSRWRFKPATKDGAPVAVAINVEVQFRLF